MDRLQIKLQGSSTIYALMISLLISSLLGVYIWLNYYQMQLLNRYDGQERAYENLLSGRLLFLNQSGKIGEQAGIQLFGSQDDSCYIQSEQWGLYGLMHGKGIYRKYQTEESCLIGQKLIEPRNASLFLVDNKQPLNVVGTTRIEGNIYIPSVGIKGSYIGRKTYENDSVFYGSSQSSRGLSVKMDQTHLGDVKAILDSIHQDTTLNDTYYLRNADFRQDWQDSALIFQSQSTVILRNVELSGKCKIITSGEILIERSAVLQDVLLFARRIRIQSKVKGRFQAFATEDIIMEEDASLTYPSVLMISRFDDKRGHLEIGEGSLLEGALIFDTQLFGANRDRADYCLIKEDAEIWGNVEVAHNLDLRGSVIGHIVTDNFLLKTPSAVYRNYLLDAYISTRPLHPTYTAPLIQEGKGFQIAEVLYR